MKSLSVPWPFSGHAIKVHRSSASVDCHRDEQREGECTHITLGDIDSGGGGGWGGRSICQANSRKVFGVRCTWHTGRGRDKRLKQQQTFPPVDDNEAATGTTRKLQ